MTQTVLIGLGGTGSRTVNNVAKILRGKDIDINDGIVTCAVLDTNQKDNKLIKGSGTDIPVIPTCDDRTIDRYLQDYAYQNPLEWCPYSRTFGASSMLSGASEMRVKSRLAFMDTMNSEGIYDLERALEKVFHNRPGTPEQIRVMLVSSLSGGTGSGMFIQTALWLRKFFESRNCMVSIRGILLLPDIFIRTIPNIRKNPEKKRAHYANAYAAIRELNALDKIVKGKLKLERPLVIPGLFDSRTPPQTPIFDNAFFIDDVDAKGAAFTTSGAYEEMVAQIVYMQLYAPMQDEMVSVEDNLFRTNENSEEPLYGSCGTAKAVYPLEDAVEYCALRAAADSIAQGWRRLDYEINAIIEDEENAEKDGVVMTTRTSFPNAYVQLFDEKSSKTGKEAGLEDKLFTAIAKDVVNETLIPAGNGETKTDAKCKVKVFMDALEKEIERSVTMNGGCKRITDVVKDLPDPTAPNAFPKDLEQTLKGLRATEKETIESVLRKFDENKQTYAAAILRDIVPMDMGSVNKNDEKSLFGLFQKKDTNDQLHCVHPVAARYLLYKLSQAIEKKQRTVSPASRRAKAIEGDTTQVKFDIEGTRKVETLDDYFNQLGLMVSKKELQHFLVKYLQYNEENKKLCVEYEKEALKQLVLNELKQKVDSLCKQMKNFFDDMDELTKELANSIEENVARNEQDLEKTLYVFSRREHKEAQYQSLGVDLTGKNNEMFEEIIKSVYGKFCADNRPNDKSNQEYADCRVIDTFYNAIRESYAALLRKEYKAKLELDIIAAIKAESDYNAKKDGKEEKRQLGDTTSNEQRAKIRYNEAVESYVKRLEHMAVPFLQAKAEVTKIDINKMVEKGYSLEDQKLWMVSGSGKRIPVESQTDLTFWGFNPAVAENFEGLEVVTGANKAVAASKGYPINELYCYGAIYAVKAENIAKFNELSGGEYYENYSAVINNMIQTGIETNTPHLDKTWHEILPYISASKQANYKQNFYKNLWLAVAHGRLSVDAAGNYQISERVKNTYGRDEYVDVPLTESGRRISVKDVPRLIVALNEYPNFEMAIARDLEEEMKKDLEDMTTYVGTKLIKGLLVEGDLNPITMTVRYATSKDVKEEIMTDMLGGLRVLMEQLANNYDANRTPEMAQEASVKLLFRLYEKCGMATKKQALKKLVKEFRALGLITEDDEDDAATEVVDII